MSYWVPAAYESRMSSMISAIGVRNMVENKTNFQNTRNVIVAAVILGLAIGISYSASGAIVLGSVSLSGLAVASIVGIILNAILPGKDYEFGTNRRADMTVHFGGGTRNPNWREEHPDEAKL